MYHGHVTASTYETPPTRRTHASMHADASTPRRPAHKHDTAADSFQEQNHTHEPTRLLSGPALQDLTDTNSNDPQYPCWAGPGPHPSHGPLAWVP
jgi:hypothetical protein